MRSYVGHWWLPENPRDRLYGTFRIRPDGAPELELVGPRPETEAPFAPLAAPLKSFLEQHKPLTVIGQTADGEAFTLFNGFPVSYPFLVRAGGVPTATFHFNRGFQGICIDDPSALQVSKIYARCPGMDAWLAARPFEIEFDDNLEWTRIRHDKPKKKTFQIDEHRRLLLVWTQRGPVMSDVQRSIKIEALPWFCIEYDRPESHEKAIADMTVISDFLSLLLGTPTLARRESMIVCSEEGLTSKARNDGVRLLGQRIKLTEPFRKWGTPDVLAPFPFVEDKLELMLQKWFRLREDCWDAIVPYIKCQITPAPYAESKLFEMAAAAESLHSHLRSDEKLNYKERLEHLLRRFPALSRDVVGDASEQDIFCSLVKDLRHAQAHRRNRNHTTKISGSTFIKLRSKLKVILDAWILAETGLSESAVESRMRQTRKYWNYASNASWPWNTRTEY